MKTLTTFLFTVFLFTLAHAQEKRALPGGYFSGYFGAGPLTIGGFTTGTAIGGGYQWNKWLGVGGSLSAQLGATTSTSSSFSGLSLQYRARPARRLVLSLDYGYIFNHRMSSDVEKLEYIPGWYPFFKIFTGWKVGSVFTLGAGFTGLPQVKHTGCNFIDPAIPCTTNVEEWRTSGVLFTLGLNFN